MKKYIIGFVLGAVLAVSGSVFATGNGGFGVSITPLQKLTPAEQAKLGYKFDKYTGKKLVPDEELSITEKRFRELEARVTKLEAKKK